MAEREPWEVFLEWDCLGTFVKPEGKVYEVVLKVQPTGVFAIVKLRGPFGYKVGFVNGKSLRDIAGKIRSLLAGESGKWSDDKFANT